jgi:transcriptional regulator with XRE-family HTH domain
MIKNKRQYRITKSQAERFARSLEHVATKKGDTLLLDLEAKALRSQLDELQQQLADYEDLQSGSRGVISVDSFDRLPHALVKARIAAGLSQKELADRLGMKEQQIQRYEATDYSSASLGRLQEVISALGVNVREEIFLPTNPASATALFDRLNAAGIERDFVCRRILPPPLAARLTRTSPAPGQSDVRQAASTIGRVFNFEVDAMLGIEPLEINAVAAGVARFKLPARNDERKVSAYTVYSHYLALLILAATPDLEPKPIPSDAEEFRDAIVSEFQTVTLESVLAFLWMHGVPVLPLCDAAAFHGAFWRVKGRNVIVLKQRTSSLARWTHDCLHETYHSSQEPDEPERSAIEEPETSSVRRESDEEQEANLFAGDVMLDGRAEELVEMCVGAANGRVERLKGVVPMIAEAEDVEVAALANYLAYRLALQGVNWWGAATNLQSSNDEPWTTARDWLLPRLTLNQLNDIDRQILLQALTTSKE